MDHSSFVDFQGWPADLGDSTDRGLVRLVLVREALNKSILDFSAPAIGKVRFSDGSQNQWLAATDFDSASLRCGKR